MQLVHDVPLLLLLAPHYHTAQAITNLFLNLENNMNLKKNIKITFLILHNYLLCFFSRA